MSDDLILSTSTDDRQAAEASLSEDQEAARVPLQRSNLRDCTRRESPDGRFTTYAVEPPDSSRHRAEEQELEEVEVALSVPESEQKSEAAADEPAASEPTGDVDTAEVRKAATARAIADGEAWAAQQRAQMMLAQQQIVPDAQAQYQQTMQQAAAAFGQRIKQITASDPDFTRATQEAAPLIQALDSRPTIVEAVTAMGADTAAFLIRNRGELEKIVAMPDHLALARLGQISSQMVPRPVARSNAPSPISALRGTAKTTIPGDEMDYQTFKRWREQQIKSKYAR